ncbi:MAG: type III-B CRISPR module RAMP protein Cmr6 [Egibacteraceae bacterium]
MSLADLVSADATRVTHPALVLGRLLPKLDPADERVDKRGKCAGVAFDRAARYQATILGKVNLRLRRLAADLERGGVPVVSFIARCATRLITGSGGGLPEVNATLVHPVYGYPYIPGSSLKGAARAEALRIGEPDLDRIFGGAPGSLESDEPGLVAFFDAVPVPSINPSPVLEVDVATVHHKRYYEGDLAEPLPTESPVPLPFLVVPAGVRFRFLLAGVSPSVPGELVASALRLLRTAMTEEGLGASTASGYGYFDAGSVVLDVGAHVIGGEQ